MKKYALIIFVFFAATLQTNAQLLVARDTINVRENAYSLKMPWGNGLNYSNVSNIDLNFDGVKDIVAFDKLNQFGTGKFRCFIKTGLPGTETYSCSPDLSYYFPDAINWAIFVDYNCDGKEDLFCSTSGGIMAYKNVSTPTAGISFTLEKPLLYSLYPAPTNYTNLYASPAGVPGISDIDGDGDIDVLTFSPQGVYVEFHQNMSKENYGHCDSLVFQLNTGCWGKIIENNCQVDLNQACAFRPANWPDYHQELQQKPLHAGSCLTCIDADADGDKDLIMGDISCNIVQFAYNTGTPGNALITDTTKLYPNYPNKNSTTQIKMNNFPCTYTVDVNGDGKQDLIATPNAFGSENTKSLWYYRNTSATNTVNFQFQKNNFFQDEMIEVGQNAYPILFDYNADGKKDLLIGTFGYYAGNSLKAQLTLYENKGTSVQPSFSLVTRDYAALSSQSLSYAMPTSGDIDGDGDQDILVGTSNGKIHWLKNTAGAGNPCTFTFTADPFGFTTLSAVAAPQLFDINKDGLLDLMIGGKNGRIAYYQNNGTATAPSFTLISNYFGSVDVKGDPNLYGIDGYASPFFYNEGINVKLLVGSVSGQVYYYSVPASITNSCTLINNKANGYNEGSQSVPFFEDINGDAKRDLFLGNSGGGVSFFSSKSPYVGIEEIDLTDENLITVFPVPASEFLNIAVTKIDVKQVTVQIIDLLGKVQKTKTFDSNNGNVDLNELTAGVYFARISVLNNQLKNATFTKKIIKE